MFSVGCVLIKRGFGRPLNNKAQVMLEFAFCFIILVIFIIAFFNALLWAGKIFVGRQRAYDNTLENTMDGEWAAGFDRNVALIHLAPTLRRNW